MLEDESGRIRLVGERVLKALLVTGVIVGVLGVETPNGEFEVVDLCAPGLAPQTGLKENERAEKMDVDGECFKCASSSILWSRRKCDRQ
jgi:DNA polymerase delta subunit 2